MRARMAVICTLLGIGSVAGMSGCGFSDGERERAAEETDAARESGTSEATRARDGRVATAFGRGHDGMTADQLERGRMNMDWRQFVRRDTLAPDTASSPAADESWDDISMSSVNSGPILLPLHGDVQGPSVLRVQVLLDRALFSPGVIDGRWGSNTEKAVYWFQEREGLSASGRVDEATWQRLQRSSGQPHQLVYMHDLTSDDVAGPFVDLPREYYDRRDMDCQCYESLGEKLAELFHTTEALLQQLNPGVNLNSVSAGSQLAVPAVTATRSTPGDGADVARIVISDGGRHLHALDADGRILYHFPATLGSAYSPSPSGSYRITAIAEDPTWHYQPELLEGVADDEPDAVLPPGPNNAVGVVWMALSEPHYGIHGTSAPETIGYATSNGCVRLTNWDAAFLAGRVAEGTPVEFRDVTR